MDPLSALSVASTVIQFVDFGRRLFSDGQELYKSTQGILTTSEELKLATADLRALLVKLDERQQLAEQIPSSDGDDKSQRTFQRILNDASEIAKELIQRLEGLEVKSRKHRRWECLWKAIQTAWTRDEILSLTRRLASFRDATQTHITFIVLEKLDADSLHSSSAFKQLDARTQLILSSLLENQEMIKATREFNEELHGQMNTIIQLIRRVDTISTAGHHEARRAVTRTQIGGRRIGPNSVQEITAGVEMLNVSTAQEARLRNSVHRNIIESLSYPAMTHRYEDIVEAYPETYEWVFENPKPEQPLWSNFSNWLKESGGVYWISGKAGSGKSTLMKHVFDDVRTRQYLRAWAKMGTQNDEHVPLCLATFFFWNSGTAYQKSQQGMLRALLHQVLSSHPELVSVVVPEVWAKAYSGLIKDVPYSLKQAWTLRRLTDAFRKLILQKSVPLKLCFLVDGLDEFDGDHEDMAALFKQAVESPNVKVCLASRPWVVFEDIYRSCPSLRLQDLTNSDIERYVNGKCKGNLAFGNLEMSDPDSVALLRTEITTKAEGVFLWVTIVVKSLLDGIRNRDDISILRQRLRDMPPEIEPLYRHLMGFIEPVYVTWASKAFKTVTTVRDFCTEEDQGYEQRTKGSTPLTISILLLATSDNLRLHVDESENVSVVEQTSSATTRTLTAQCLPAKCEDMKTHLTARCGGLLEVRQYEKDGCDAQVKFLHRTAREFIEREENWSHFLDHKRMSTFESYNAMLMALVMFLAIRCPTQSVKSAEARYFATEAMLYAYHLDLQQETQDSGVAVLDMLDNIMTQWRGVAQRGRGPWSSQLIVELGHGTDLGFLGLATLYGLSRFVHQKLIVLDRKASSEMATRLLHILLPSKGWPRWANFPSPRSSVVELLLNFGANPNFAIGNPTSEKSTWENVLLYLNDIANGPTGPDSPPWILVWHSSLKIIQLLVLAGADPDLVVSKIQQPGVLFDGGMRFIEAESIIKKLAVRTNELKKERQDILEEMRCQREQRKAESASEITHPPRKKRKTTKGRHHLQGSR